MNGCRGFPDLRKKDASLLKGTPLLNLHLTGEDIGTIHFIPIYCDQYQVHQQYIRMNMYHNFAKSPLLPPASFLRYLTLTRLYSLVPRPIFSAWARVSFQRMLGLESMKWSL